jgi:hypothetical protein
MNYSQTQQIVKLYNVSIKTDTGHWGIQPLKLKMTWDIEKPVIVKGVWLLRDSVERFIVFKPEKTLELIPGDRLIVSMGSLRLYKWTLLELVTGDTNALRTKD